MKKFLLNLFLCVTLLSSFSTMPFDGAYKNIDRDLAVAGITLIGAAIFGPVEGIVGFSSVLIYQKIFKK